MLTSLQLWEASILVSGRPIGDCMAAEDWFDVRGAVAWVTEQTMDKTIGMTRFWEQKYWLSDFSAEFAMAAIIFVVTMLSVLGPVWMERKLIARLMDHRGSTIAIRSLWTGEGRRIYHLELEFQLVGLMDSYGIILVMIPVILR